MGVERDDEAVGAHVLPPAGIDIVVADHPPEEEVEPLARPSPPRSGQEAAGLPPRIQDRHEAIEARQHRGIAGADAGPHAVAQRAEPPEHASDPRHERADLVPSGEPMPEPCEGSTEGLVVTLEYVLAR